MYVLHKYWASNVTLYFTADYNNDYRKKLLMNRYVSATNLY